MNEKTTQKLEELKKLEKESVEQVLPEQQAVYSVSAKIRKRVSNLPDPTNAPWGYDPQKGFDKAFPYVRLPFLHTQDPEDNISFGHSELEPNKLYFGDNLQVLRSLKTESIDLIYIDPPFFSGRNYNVIWGDSNEVRSFFDVWEGGIKSYLIWLNARLWEMRRVLKSTGSIYVHCDWHASHYIKQQMDYIFGYDNFGNEIIWKYSTFHGGRSSFKRDHQVILSYSKTDDFTYNYGDILDPYAVGTIKRFDKKDEQGRYKIVKGKKFYMQEGNYPSDVWEIKQPQINAVENIGYPTQKPEALLERIIKASSNESDVVADFFCGGGTTQVVAQRLKRQFIGCDSSRVAISVSLNRLIRDAEQLSGKKSSTNKQGDLMQGKLIGEKIPDIDIYYHGIYPIEKFRYLEQEDFKRFILTCYGASQYTGEGEISGFKSQREPILIGSADSEKDIDGQRIKRFVEDSLKRVNPNTQNHLKVIAWKFGPKVKKYQVVINHYFYQNNIPADIEFIPINSQRFRERILELNPSIEDSELLLRFTSEPIIGKVVAKKIKGKTYKFIAQGAVSTNLDGYLINCQWDFDMEESKFATEAQYALNRQKVKVKMGGGTAERFEAVLEREYTFENSGDYLIGCKVQDNLGGEAIKTIKLKVD